MFQFLDHVFLFQPTHLHERVEDVFFLTDQTGNRLNDDAICDALKSALCKVLDTDVAA